MEHRYAEAIAESAACKRVDESLSQPDSKPRAIVGVSGKSLDRVEMSAVGRRFSRLAYDLGFRLTDSASVAISVWLTNEAGIEDGVRIGLVPALLAICMVNIAFSVGGIYHATAILLRYLDIERLLRCLWQSFSWWLLAMILADAVLSPLGKTTVQDGIFIVLHPVTLIAILGITTVMVSGGRLALIKILESTSATGALRERTYMLGTGIAAEHLAERLSVADDPRLDVLGYFDDGLDPAPPAAIGELPWLGGINGLITLIRQGQVDTVLVATAWTETVCIDQIMRRLAGLPVSVELVPEEVPFGFPYRMVQSTTGLPILRVCEKRLSDTARLIKKLEDLVLAPLLLLCLLPLMAVIAVWIKLDSPGPVLFRQSRYGRDNKIIRVAKFRTMYVEAADEYGEKQAVRDDPRLTRAGKFLRAASLDELPQLFNVLSGDMSIVGPRPHALSTRAEGQLFEDAVATYMARHRVLPGITGWAQVNGWRGETDTLEKIHKRVEHDLYYIGNWSLAFDLAIIFRTLRVLLKGENAY
jgi:polysaccharide biosynthesis protein PslA